MKAIVFGSDGQLGTRISGLLRQRGHSVAGYTSKDCDFTSQNVKSELKEAKLADYRLIVNCAGLIDGGTNSFDKIFNVNVRSNFEIFEYFVSLESCEPVGIFVCGSTAANNPRKRYPLYAASKTALCNLVASYKEIFQDTNVNITHAALEKFGNQMGSSSDLPESFIDDALTTFESFLRNMETL